MGGMLSLSREKKLVHSKFLSLLPVIPDVGVRRVFNHTEREFRLYGTKRENIIKIPSANLHNGWYTLCLSNLSIICLLSQ